MSTSEGPPEPGDRAVKVVAVVAVVLLAVVAVLAVVVVRAGDPQSTPRAERPGTAGAAAYDEAFAQVRGLTRLATDYGVRLDALATAYERSGTGTRTGRAESAYDEARTGYRQAVNGLGGLPGMQDTELVAAYERFRDQAAASIAYGDAFAGVKRTLTVCGGVFSLDEDALAEQLPAAHQQAADACRPTLPPLASSRFEVVASFATAFATLLQERQVIYDGVFGFGSISGEDGAAQIDASYARFAPALAAISAPDGLSRVKDEVDVTDSYQALYALLVERTAA